MKIRTRYASAMAALALISSAALAAGPSTTDFSNGMGGWVGDEGAVSGYHGIDPTMGDGSLGFHSDGLAFGYVLQNSSNPGVLGDYTGMKSFTFSLDVSVNKVADSSGLPMTEALVLELRDLDKPGTTLPYSSLWIVLGYIGLDQPKNQHLSVTVGDTSLQTLPAGWHGAGGLMDWDQTTLPPGQTFNRILQDVDQVVISTYLPGILIGVEREYDMTVDNIAVSAVPEPGQWGMLGVGLGLLGFTARRRKAQRLG